MIDGINIAVDDCHDEKQCIDSRKYRTGYPAHPVSTKGSSNARKGTRQNTAAWVTQEAMKYIQPTKSIISVLRPLKI